jgi:hypothetical protein
VKFVGVKFMITDQEIWDAEEACAVASDAHRKALAHCHALRVQRATEQFGVSYGTRVRDNKGRECIVDEIKPWHSGKPRVSGRQIKKDGSVGGRSINMYGRWEICTTEIKNG